MRDILSENLHLSTSQEVVLCMYIVTAATAGQNFDQLFSVV